jgi:deoxycytidylate deaminase
VLPTTTQREVMRQEKKEIIGKMCSKLNDFMQRIDRGFTPVHLDQMKMKALLASLSATCARASVGCVIFDKETWIDYATGYNGSVAKTPHCIEVGCVTTKGHCVRCNHAEMNALFKLSKINVHNRNNLILISTHEPCINCLRHTVSNGIRHILYGKSYSTCEIDEAREVLLKDYFRNGLLLTYSMDVF